MARLPKCKICGEEFERRVSTVKVCSPRCAIELVRLNQERATRRKAKEDRVQQRKARERLKTRSDWLREAQRQCNVWIRQRDRHQTCISCGNPPKKRNAGHYRSVGAAPELRFHPLNIHLQCESCNSFKSGNQAEYRINLIKKIGLKLVEWLEGPHEPQRYTIEDAKEIKQWYKDRIKYG